MLDLHGDSLPETLAMSCEIALKHRLTWIGGYLDVVVDLDLAERECGRARGRGARR